MCSRDADQLATLAGLLRDRNRVEREIAALIGRPAHSGHIAEYIAARILDIQLHESASAKGTDGIFRLGPYQLRTVNVKYKSRNDGLLDINTAGLSDFYLVLSGPWTAPISSRGTVAPWTVSHVFLFETTSLLERLRARSVKIGIATSVIRSLWEEAEIFPVGRNQRFELTGTQRGQLRLFDSEGVLSGS